MAQEKKRVWLPFFDTRAQDEALGKVQMNPATAVKRSESKQNARMVLTATSLLAVLAVIFVGRSWLVNQPQNVTVGAMVHVKNAVAGVVTDVDPKSNTFILGYQSSTDTQVSESGVTTWKVSLAPGANFDPRLNTLPICYSVQNINESVSDAQSVDCQDILKPGQQVIVQYVVVYPTDKSMTASAVYGSMK